MWSKETIKNKIYALVLIGIGVLSIFPENDATACMFFCIIGVPLFFAKENWIMNGGGSDYVYEKAGGKVYGAHLTAAERKRWISKSADSSQSTISNTLTNLTP